MSEFDSSPQLVQDYVDGYVSFYFHNPKDLDEIIDELLDLKNQNPKLEKIYIDMSFGYYAGDGPEWSCQGRRRETPAEIEKRRVRWEKNQAQLAKRRVKEAKEREAQKLKNLEKEKKLYEKLKSKYEGTP